jgi:pullulanase
LTLQSVTCAPRVLAAPSRASAPLVAGPVDRVERGRQLAHPADGIVCDLPLGALYQPGQTTFRVWAPTASQVRVRLYDSPVGGEPRVVDMRQADDGSWSTTVSGDCKGKYYTYTAAGSDAGFDPARELVDPYAHAVTACDGRAIVVGDDAPEVAPRPSFPVGDAIVYEMHLRDFTIDPDSGVERRGQYLGMTETGTRLHGHPEVETGLDHLTELGVNTVQIMPFTEYRGDEAAQQYNWGYDPVLYQTPDGMYASERLDASRVAEARRMVDALHRRGIRVIMDVVLNHTVEDIRSKVYNFEGLVPGYFYRRHLDGSYWNGSGCGNEVRSEAPMARRFIKDTVKYWASAYKVDGFRFDLMGLIDKETMREVAAELHAMDPGIIVYGEPWTAGATPIEPTVKGSQRGLGFGVFNDDFRDALKGSVFQAGDRGFVQDGSRLAAVRRGVAGSVDSFAAAPVESINYVECHDNLTLWDKLAASAPGASEAEREAMDRLSAAVLFTSFGVPFIQSGQEMLRTKGGDDNSYNKPDAVNMIRWEEKAEHLDVFHYYQGLIAMRKAHPMFRLASAGDVRKALRFFDQLGVQMPDRTLGYVIDDVTGRDGWKRAAVIVNGDARARDLPLPAGAWVQVADAARTGLERPLSGSTISVPPHGAVILAQPR